MKLSKFTTLYIIIVLISFLPAILFAEPYGAMVRELTPKASFSIDHTQGKEVDIPNTRGKIKIPPGSLNKKETIEVQQVEIAYDKQKFNKMGEVYRFGPHGLKFNKPAFITLPYTEPEEYPEEFVNIYYYSTDNNAWEVMDKTDQDKDNNTITVKITHFSDYAPGVGSYAVEEGLSPNSSFFKNNNEYVDRYRGNLIIERTDVNIPGRGLDLVVKSVFNSDWYYWHCINRETLDCWYEGLRWDSIIEERGIYKIADGWHFKFPAMFEYTSSNYIFQTENGTLYNLTNAIKSYISEKITTTFCIEKINTMAYVDGYMIYDETFTPNYYGATYHRVIELVREKIIIECEVTDYNGQFTISEISANYPDGKIVEFNDINHTPTIYGGKVNKIYDASRKNHLTFSYSTEGKLESITDTIGRVLEFTYADSNITLSLTEGTTTYKLVKYERDSMGLKSIQYRDHDSGESLQTTQYDYTKAVPFRTTITYPSGGISRYNFNPIYSCRDGYGFSKRLFVMNHILKENSSSSQSETQNTSYSYFNRRDNYMLIVMSPFDIMDITVGRTDTILSDASGDNKQQKISTYYNYTSNDKVMGESAKTTEIYDENVWTLTKKVYNELVEIIPEYYEPQKTSYYCGEFPTLTIVPGEYPTYTTIYTNPYKYYTEYDYDWYGQLIKEKKVDKDDNTLKETYYDYLYSYKGDYFDYEDPLEDEIPFSLTLSDWEDVTDTPVVALKEIILDTGFETEGNVTFELLSMSEYGVFGNDPYSGTDYSALKKHGLGLLTGIVNKQSDTLTQETYFKYDTNRNLVEIKKKKESSVTGSVAWLKTGFGYDSAYNNLTSITDPEGNEITLNYDTKYSAYIAKDSRIIAPPIELPDGAGIAYHICNEFEHDDLGRLSNKYGYLADNNSTPSPIPEYYTDKIIYSFDDLNRVTTVGKSVYSGGWGAETGVRKFEYDDTNNKLTSKVYLSDTSEDNYIKVFKEYDGLDRLTNETSYKWDGNGGLVTDYIKIGQKDYFYHPVFTDKTTRVDVYEDTSGTNKHTMEYSYDQYRRIIETKAEDNIISKIYYDDDNNQITYQNYRNDTTFTQKQEKKDWNGQVIRVKEWDQTGVGSAKDPPEISGIEYQTDYEYDLAGNVIFMQNAVEKTFNYKFNTLGQIEETEYEDNTYELATYDRNGNIIESVDRNGNKKLCIYNSLNQATEIVTKDLSNTITGKTKIAYGRFGTPIKITEQDAYESQLCEYLYEYNGQGLVSKYDQYIGPELNSKHYKIEYYYDRANNLHTLAFYNDTSLLKTLNYNPIDNNLDNSVESNVIVDSDHIARIKNNYWGGIDSIKYGNGTSGIINTAYSYWSDTLFPKDIVSTKTADSMYKMNLYYEYDWQGNVTRWINSISRNTITRNFTYDGMDRLSSDENVTLTYGNKTIYTYDGIGNRDYKRYNCNSHEDTDYDDPNDYEKQHIYYSTNGMRLKNFDGWNYGYDNNSGFIEGNDAGNGNLTHKSDGINTWEYTYNEHNQLTEVRYNNILKSQYTYDPNGLRIIKIEGNDIDQNDGKTTLYVYQGQSILYEETFNTTDWSQLNNNKENRKLHIELAGKNLAKYVWTATTGWDPTDADIFYHLPDHLGSRQVVCDAAGDVITEGDVEYGTFGEHNAGAAEDYSYTGKEIDSTTGLVYFNARFYDPAIGRFVTMDPVKDGVNWYVYCGNNPLKYVDPTGLFTTVDYGTINDMVNTAFSNSSSFGPYVGFAIAGVILGALLQGDSMPNQPGTVNEIDTEQEDEAVPEPATDGAGALSGNGNKDNGNNFVTRGKGRAPKIGLPNTIYEQIDDNGIVRSRTYYDENGHSFSREDFDHSHGGMQPHEHQRTYNEDGQAITKETVIEIDPENQ